MAYLDNVTARAGRDLAHLYREISAEHSDAALRSYGGLTEAIPSLEEQPNRCPVTPGSAKLRHLLYGNKAHVYRAIYGVLEREKRVEVLHIPPRREAEVDGVRCQMALHPIFKRLYRECPGDQGSHCSRRFFRRVTADRVLAFFGPSFPSSA